MTDIEWNTDPTPEDCAVALEGGLRVETYHSRAWAPTGRTAVGFRRAGLNGHTYRVEVGPVLAKTWEDCARHVEAGGVVEVGRVARPLRDDRVGPDEYRARDYAPGKGGYLPRRLVPIPKPAPEPKPEGYDAVYLPSAEVDRLIASWHGGILTAACQAAVARRPKPVVKTEHIPWHEAAGRLIPDGRYISEVKGFADGIAPALYLDGLSAVVRADPDGMVEVEVES